MQQELHYHKRIKAGSNIVDDDPSTRGKPLELPHRWRFKDIESAKKYKAAEQGFPRHRSEQQRYPLAGNFVNDYLLWIFDSRAPCHRCRRWNTQSDRDRAQAAKSKRLKTRLNEV